MDWNPERLPAAPDRAYAITGGTAGIGYFAAEQLASTGARVVLLSRSPEKLERARAAIRGQVPDARVDVVPLELGALASVAAAAAELAALPRLDGILLNGGPMDLRAGRRTRDGLPFLVGTHHVANAALVAGVLPLLAATGEVEAPARIVHTSTGFVQRFPQRIDGVLSESRLAVRAYTQAKTVTELFAFELDRRLRAAGLPVASVVSRPGVGVDAKTPTRPGVHDATTPRRRNPYTPWAQGKDTAAWSAVRAMLDPDLRGGEYVAPAGALRGLPVLIEPDPRTAAPADGLAERVWRQTEELIGRAVVPAPAAR